MAAINYNFNIANQLDFFILSFLLSIKKGKNNKGMNHFSPKDLAIVVANETLILCAERAIFYPSQNTLFIADAHFGKAATFRARGLPVPQGTTAFNLEQLDILIERTRASEIIFLGDLFHAKEAHAVRNALLSWRENHFKLKLTLIMGNHDHHAGAPDQAYRCKIVSEPYQCGPFQLCHHPQIISENYVIAGHEHPVINLKSKSDRCRLPCFNFGKNLAVLPAFGSFTGGMPVNPNCNALFVCTSNQVLPVNQLARKLIKVCENPA